MFQVNAMRVTSEREARRYKMEPQKVRLGRRPREKAQKSQEGRLQKAGPTKARNELRHYKEGTRFRLLFPEIPAGGVDEGVVVPGRDVSPTRPGRQRTGPQ